MGYLARPLAGAAMVRGYALLMGTVQLLNQLPNVAFDANCELRYQQLRAQRIKIGTQDLRIASVALVHGLTVLTRNQRDFGRVPGLTIDDWCT